MKPLFAFETKPAVLRCDQKISKSFPSFNCKNEFPNCDRWIGGWFDRKQPVLLTIRPAVKLILAALIFWVLACDALIYWITALALSVLGIIDRSHGGRCLKGLP